MKELAKRFKYIRLAFNLSQKEFADKLGFEEANVLLYERGKLMPTDENISDICEKFDVSFDWLNKGYGEMFATPPAVNNEQ